MTTATQPSACASSSQPARRLSSSRARGMRRRRGLRGGERGRLERAEAAAAARRGARAGVACSATTRPVSASLPGRRLDLDVERVAVLQAERGDAFERGRRLAGEGAAVPRAGVEPRQLAPGEVGGAAVAAGGALQGGVVEQEGHAVGGELDVAFEGAIAVARAEAERGERVLGRQLAGAAVRDPARDRARATSSRPQPLRRRRAPSSPRRTSACARASTAMLTMSPTFGCAAVASSRAVKSVSPSVP